VSITDTQPDPFDSTVFQILEQDTIRFFRFVMHRFYSENLGSTIKSDPFYYKYRHTHYMAVLPVLAFTLNEHLLSR